MSVMLFQMGNKYFVKMLSSDWISGSRKPVREHLALSVCQKSVQNGRLQKLLNDSMKQIALSFKDYKRSGFLKP